MCKLKSRIFFITFFMVALMTVVAWAVYLPKTGQTVCYDSSGYEAVSCPAPGVTACVRKSDSSNQVCPPDQDGSIKAGVDWWPSSRFTNMDGTTPISGGVVVDQLTGLMWLRDANCASTIGYDPDATADGSLTWQHALDFVNLINTNPSYSACNGGFADWRLPNINELYSLYHSSYIKEACSGGIPCAFLSDWLNYSGFNNFSSSYWSSTTLVSNSNSAWFLYTGAGVDGIIAADPKNLFNIVLPVRGPVKTGMIQLPQTGQTTSYDANGKDDGALKVGSLFPVQRFTPDAAGKAVTDIFTGLMWLKDANCIWSQYPSFDADSTAGDGKVEWVHAIDFVNKINTNPSYSNCGAGYTGWRLPNVQELKSLLNYGVPDNSVWLNGTQGFSNVQPMDYWASTSDAQYSGPGPYVFYTTRAWMASMSNSSASTGFGASFLWFPPNVFDFAYLWPVRDTPNIQVDTASLNFGNVDVGNSSASQNVTINNTGTSDLVISSVAFSTSTFDFTKDNVCTTIAKGGSCTVKVILNPHFAGPKDTSLVITSNDPDTPIVYLSLSGAAKSTLNVSVSGSGTVKGTGIDCPDDCTEVYSPTVAGTVPGSLTLTATPNSGNKFASWTGCPSASGNQCTVDPGKNNNVTANFEFIPIVPVVYNLKISPIGPGSGTIMSTPSGINCSFDGTNVSGDCSKSYDSNQMVTLTAKPLIDSTGKTLSSLFTGWGDACSGTKPCLVKMDSEKTVSANFELNKPVISVDLTDNALDFGSVKPGKLRNKAIKITNAGTKGPLTISAAIIDGDIDSFSQRLGGKMTIKPGKVYGLRVMFKPKSKGPKAATLRINSNDPDHPTTDIKLTGAGL